MCIRDRLQAYVTECGGQARAAELLHVNQGTISRCLRPPGQPQLRVLLALREKLGASLDELLGLALPPPASERQISTDKVAQQLAEVADRLSRLERKQR